MKKECSRCKKTKPLSCFINIRKELKTCDVCRHKDLSYNRKNKTKDYYKTHVDDVKKYNSKKVKCDCGMVVNRGSYSYHCRSKFHIRYLVDNNKTIILNNYIRKGYLFCLKCLGEKECYC